MSTVVRLVSFLAACTVLTLGTPLPSVHAQTASAAKIVPAPNSGRGSVVVTVNGKQKTLAENAGRVFRIQDGKLVLWSGTDGAGGFENEGESLWCYTVATGKRVKLLSATKMVDDVKEIRSLSGQSAYLVRLSDSQVGVGQLVVVHPTKGKVWEQDSGTLLSHSNGKLTVGVFPDVDSWNLDEKKGKNPPYGKPKKVVTVDLDTVLKRQPMALRKQTN